MRAMNAQYISPIVSTSKINFKSLKIKDENYASCFRYRIKSIEPWWIELSAVVYFTSLLYHEFAFNFEFLITSSPPILRQSVSVFTF